MSRQKPRSWPEGFMWGTGASSTQCEGAAPASDWYDLLSEDEAQTDEFAERFYGITWLAGLALRTNALRT